MDIKPDYANVASVVFSSPQVAQVGINEDKAVEEHGDVDIFTSTFSWVPNALHAPPAVVLGEQGHPPCEDCLDSVLVLMLVLVLGKGTWVRPWPKRESLQSRISHYANSG